MLFSRYLLVSFNILLTLSVCRAQSIDKLPEYARILQQYVQFPSIQYHEKQAGSYLLEQCKQKGLITEILSPGDSSFNFIASVYPLTSGKPNIVFLNHIDVVIPGDTTLWKYPPFSGTIKDSLIWGRGTLDNKGMAVAQLLAIADMAILGKQTDLPYNISLLSVSGEETGGQGASYVVDNFLDKINPVLIFGEGGSGMKGLIQTDPEKIVFGVSTAEKTRLVLRLDMALSSSGHGSVPPKEYAMKEMIFALEKLLKKKPRITYNNISVKALKTLGQHEKGIKGFIQKHFTFIAFKPLVKRRIKKDPMRLSFFANTITFTNLTIPDGNDNQISQQASATFDCRLLPGVNTERFLRNIEKWIRDDRITLNVIYQGIAAPKTESTSPFYNVLLTALNDVYPNSAAVEMVFPASTDNNFFRAKGIPVLGLFPSCFTQDEVMAIHNVNERIHFERLEKATTVYKKILETLIRDFR